jgi:hypothetical protein
MMPIPTRWVTPARSSCILMAPWKVGMIRAQMVAQRASDRKIYAKTIATK